ncbi:NAD(P)-binding protein, partial [Cryphonectria parasitica EP155]
MGTPPGFVYHQFTFKPKPLPKSVDLTGKTMIITGANVGLGLEASKEMAQHGLSRLILAVRSASKGEAAKQEILKVAPKCDVQVWDLDYELPENMAAFAERARSLDRVDIVILCAAVKSLEFQLSKGGHEMNVQVNHLGTAALSLLLLPVLRATA